MHCLVSNKPLIAGAPVYLFLIAHSFDAEKTVVKDMARQRILSVDSFIDRAGAFCHWSPVTPCIEVVYCEDGFFAALQTDLNYKVLLHFFSELYFTNLVAENSFGSFDFKQLVKSDCPVFSQKLLKPELGVLVPFEELSYLFHKAQEAQKRGLLIVSKNTDVKVVELAAVYQQTLAATIKNLKENSLAASLPWIVKTSISRVTHLEPVLAASFFWIRLSALNLCDGLSLPDDEFNLSYPFFSAKLHTDEKAVAQFTSQVEPYLLSRYVALALQTQKVALRPSFVD